MSILLSAVSGARSTARAAVCMSNQRQILTAMNAYASTYAGVIPRDGQVIDDPTFPQLRRLRLPWAVAFRPFMDDRASSETESDDLFVNSPIYRDPGRFKDSHNLHYVVNAMPMEKPGHIDGQAETNFWFRRGPVSIARFAFPSDTLYLTEFGNDTYKSPTLAENINALPMSDMYRAGLYDIWRIGHITPTDLEYRIGSKRHGGRSNPGGNAAYLDGHVNFVKHTLLESIQGWDDRDYGARDERPTSPKSAQ